MMFLFPLKARLSELSCTNGRVGTLTSANRLNMIVVIFNQSHPMSRTPNSRKEETHERIVDAAARAIQRHGYAGVGVADVMKEAGLTHGGFYAHFDSPAALPVEALQPPRP